VQESCIRCGSRKLKKVARAVVKCEECGKVFDQAANRPKGETLPAPH
jgi:ribosomal protein L37AE/L43A